MRLHFLIQFMILSIFSSSFAQEQLFQEEITMVVEGFTSAPIVTYTLEAIGKVWANSEITTSYNIAEEVITGNATFSDHYGWRIFWEEAPYDAFAHGLYKLKTNLNTNYVYLDFRDCQFANQSYTPNYSTDFAIKYNSLNDEFSYEDKLASVYTPISTGEVVRIWSIKNGDPITSCFGSYWANCLALVPTSDNHPHLVWGPNPSFNSTYYRIYRAVSNSPVKPVSLNYTLIQTVDSLTFDVTDYDVTILSGYQYAYYYVAGWNGTSESEKTNYVSTPAEFHKEAVTEVYNEYELTENYPNPFNPTTIISYQLSAEGLVILKVYDILGSEVVTLVNEEKPAGKYKVRFDASRLSSGVYFYRITAGSFTDIKKMILLR